MLDLGDAHIFGMAFVMKEDVAFDPVGIGIFGAAGITLEAARIADQVEQFLGGSIARSLFDRHWIQVYTFRVDSWLRVVCDIRRDVIQATRHFTTKTGAI